MNCPKCDSDQAFVVDVRPFEHGRIKRRRECMFCGTRFNTVEIKEEDYKGYKELKLKMLRWVSE